MSEREKLEKSISDINDSFTPELLDLIFQYIICRENEQIESMMDFDKITTALFGNQR